MSEYFVNKVIGAVAFATFRQNFLQSEYTVKKCSFNDTLRRFCVLCPTALLVTALFVVPSDVVAASWQWSEQNGRERLEIFFDSPQEAANVVRDGFTSLDIRLQGAANTPPSGNAPNGELIQDVTADNQDLRVQLKDQNFGYVVSQPTPQSLRVDFFADPLGARWRPPAQAAIPPPPLPIAPQTTQPQNIQPQVTAPQPTVSQAAAPTNAFVQQPVAQQTIPPLNEPEIQGSLTAEPVETQPFANVGIQGENDARITGQNPMSDGRTLMVAPNGQALPVAADPNMAVSPPSLEELAQTVQRIEQFAQTPSGNEQTSTDMSSPSLSTPAANNTQIIPPPSADLLAPAQTLAPPPADLLAPTQTLAPPPADLLAPTQTLASPQELLSAPSATPAAAPKTEIRGGLLKNAPSVSALSTTDNSSVTQTIPPPPIETQEQTIPPPPAVTQTPLAENNSYGSPVSSNLTAATGVAPSVVQPLASTTEDPQANQDGRTVIVAKPGEQLPADLPENVIYVDEQGNVVDKPPDILTMLQEAKHLLEGMQFPEALAVLQKLKALPLPDNIREEVLYLISETLVNMYDTDKLQGFEAISQATNEAMNFNLESPHVPEALYRLAMLNLDVGNQGDAIGYVRMLHTRYPRDPNVPLAMYQLGEDQLRRQQYAEAARTFQTVLDEYPEHRLAREVSRSLAEALYRQGHFERAQIMVDFIDRRWPRLYLDDPSYLLMVGEILTRMGRYDDALQNYWVYYNLLPDGEDSHRVLLQIGAIYIQAGRIDGAREVYEELLEKYPDSPSAPTAIMVLGEQGFTQPNPPLDELLGMYARNSNASPEAAYRQILQDYPDSPEAAKAAFREAVLDYANGATDEAMRKAKNFIEEHPVDLQTNRARDLILRGFDKELALAFDEDNTDRILTLWERYPEVQEAHTPLDDDLRVALARAHLNRGNEQTGMELLSFFLDQDQGEYSDYAYKMFLSKYLTEGNWEGLLVLGDKVSDWVFSQEDRNQLDYARAISAENLGMTEAAMQLWKTLYALPDGALPLYQKAYAAYFMARDAEQRRDLQETYDRNLETLELFRRLHQEDPERIDTERERESMAGLMDVSEVAGRFAEALDWADQYESFVPEGSPDHAGLLFRQARLYRKMGDLARWRNRLETIVRTEPESVFGRMAASELRTQEVARDLTRFVAPPSTAEEQAPQTAQPQAANEG